MSEVFEGFRIEYLIGDSPTRPAVVTCLSCGVESLRETGYMANVCDEITCKKCGNRSIKSDKGGSG